MVEEYFSVLYCKSELIFSVRVCHFQDIHLAPTLTLESSHQLSLTSFLQSDQTGLCPPPPICPSRSFSRSKRSGIEQPMIRSQSSNTGSIGKNQDQSPWIPKISLRGIGSSSLSTVVWDCFFFNRSMVPMPVMIPQVTFISMDETNKSVKVQRTVMTRTNWMRTTENVQSSLVQKK